MKPKGIEKYRLLDTQGVEAEPGIEDRLTA